MRTATAPLIALLNGGGRIDFADLYTITLVGGLVLRYTDHDQPITWAGNTYLMGPLIKRGKTKALIGVVPDTMEFTLNAGPNVLVNGIGILAFIAQGGFDGARVRCDRLYTASWTTAPAGSLLVFEGRQSDAKVNRNEAQLTAVSDLELLNARIPRNLFQPGCTNTLYDNACGKSKAALTVSNAVSGAAAPAKTAVATTLAQAAGYFNLGVITFTSGANNGISRTVKVHANALGIVTFMNPMPFLPAIGDTFTIYPGCDKTQATCNSKFANTIRFRGAPYIPVPETVT